MKKLYSNKKGSDLKHEMYQYDSSSDMVRFNFFGFSEKRSENFCSFDRSINVMLIVFEAFERSEPDVDRQVKKF